MPNTIDAFPIDETFEREYDVEVLRDMPSSPSIPRYGTGGGPILRVTRHGGQPFIVTVPGTLETTHLSTWPHPRRLAVFDGSACPMLIDVDAPEHPVMLKDAFGHGLASVVTFRRQEIVVIATCCTLIAYDREGRAWDASGLFCCDDPVVDRTDDALIVVGESHTTGRRRYVLDPRTGAELR